MAITKRVDMDNIVRISSKKPLCVYMESVIKKSQPNPYEKYECIKLQFTKDLKKNVLYMIGLFANCGYVYENKSLHIIEGGVRVDRGVTLNEVLQCNLKKIGATRCDNDEYLKIMQEAKEDFNNIK